MIDKIQITKEIKNINNKKKTFRYLKFISMFYNKRKISFLFFGDSITLIIKLSLNLNSFF